MALVRKLVVAGLVVSPAGDRILITQRRVDQALGGQWEFPGGKVESGESPIDALVRELEEEIAVTVQVGVIWEVLYHRYPDFELVMLVYPCRIADAREPAAIEVADLVWCRPEELSRYPILPADQPLLDRLVAEGIPGV